MTATLAIHQKAQALKREIDSTDDPYRYLEEEWHTVSGRASQ